MSILHRDDTLPISTAVSTSELDWEEITVVSMHKFPAVKTDDTTCIIDSPWGELKIDVPNTPLLKNGLLNAIVSYVIHNGVTKILVHQVVYTNSVELPPPYPDETFLISQTPLEHGDYILKNTGVTQLDWSHVLGILVGLVLVGILLPIVSIIVGLFLFYYIINSISDVKSYPVISVFVIE